jgi:UDP-glucose 4-epimerase
MNLKTKKILITGSRGFIGSNLNRYLTSKGSTVETFDLENGKDVTNEKSLTDSVKKKFDVIIHLAGFSGSRESNEEIYKSFYINTFPTAKLCDLICKFSPKTKLILSSSRLEYGIPKYLPVDEKHPINPISAYGLSKLASTQMAIVYFLQRNLNVTVFRTSNVYGPHAQKKFEGYNLVNYFIDLAKSEKEITIFGNGNQQRDYIYIDDLMDAFTSAIINVKSIGQIYNLGSGKGISLKEMAQTIIGAVGKGKIKFINWPKKYQEVETGNYVTNLKKINTELNFSPKVKFEDGIKMTINSLW